MRCVAASAVLALAVGLAQGPAAAAVPERVTPATHPVAPGWPAADAALRAAARQVVAAGATGVIVRVDDGRRVTRFAVGAGRLSPWRPLSPDDEFRVGSNTKMFVATVVLQLVAEGRLSLDDSVERWLPGVVPGGAGITLRMLLDHTGGVFDYAQDEDLLAIVFAEAERVEHTFTPADLVGYATAHPPTFAPGTGWAYSNTDYVLLGMVLERATGQTVGDLVDRRIARPLHLRHTYLQTSEAFRGRYAHGYVTPADTGDGYLDLSGRDDATWAGAAGAMVSTVDELARFTTALQAGWLLPPALLAQMRTTVSASTGQVVPDASYGLGLMSFTTPCGTFWGHYGSIPGYKSRSFSDAAGRRSVEVFTPTESTDAVVAAADALTEQALCASVGRSPSRS
ncbi:hypothetical protein Cch01nite_07310 [Cellulomonas chitinilytica]|uniref:Beta-lactamase-related domain-containing protein n=1 Tax=Cellulomonas chitinilytica TaxID=398759 RepID=A0A919NYR7_9CELL|nr:hypothetical protein Cch01nite_07310 [Cellulomonas chitinilytica]